MASPTRRSWGTSGASGVTTSHTAAEPSGAASGDCIVMAVMISNQGSGPGTVTTPTGWTLHGSMTHGTQYKLFLYSITRGGSAPSYVISWSTSLTGDQYVETITGAFTPSGGSTASVQAYAIGSAATGTQPDPPAATATTTNTTAAVFGSTYITGWSSNPAAPSGYTQGAGGGFNDLASAYKALSASGSEDPGVFGALSGSDSISGLTVIIQTDASSGITGTGAATVSGPVAAGAGALAIAGAGAATVAGPTASGAGAHASITGTGAATVAGPVASGTGALAIKGQGAATVSGPVAAGAGALAIAGAGAASIAAPTAAATGTHVSGYRLLIMGNSLASGSMDVGGPTNNHLGGSTGLITRVASSTVFSDANALASIRTAQCISRYSSTVLPQKDSARENWVIFWETQNQIEWDTMINGSMPSATAIADEVARLEAFAATVHADGMKIMVITCPPINETPLDSYLAAFGTAINASTAFDAVFDIRRALLAQMTPAGLINGNLNFSGNVHFSDAGYDLTTQATADYLRAAIVGHIASANITVPGPVAAGAGTHPGASITGTGAATVAGPVASGTGALAIKGQGAATVSGPVAAGAGALAIAGAGAASIAAPTAAGAGALAISGQGSAQVPAPVASGVGTGGGIVGAGAATVSGPVAAGAGALAIAGAGAATVGLVAAGTGALAISGTGAAAIGGPVASGAGQHGIVIVGTGAASIAGPTASGVGALAIAGSGAATVAGPVASGTGALAIKGQGAAVLSLTAGGTGSGPEVYILPPIIRARWSEDRQHRVTGYTRE